MGGHTACRSTCHSNPYPSRSWANNIMSAEYESVSVIPERIETEVIIVLYCYTLGALSIHGVESREKSGIVYDPLLPGEGR